MLAGNFDTVLSDEIISLRAKLEVSEFRVKQDGPEILSLIESMKTLIGGLDGVEEDDVLNPRKILLFTDHRLNTLFKFNSMRRTVEHLKHRSYDFVGLRTTQVYKDLYAFT